MMHYQISFTRLGGQGSGDGWQVVNASPELSAETAENFARFQNGNTRAPLFDAEDAEQQIVTELQLDGRYAFFTKIKYGLSDGLGRPAMFAHAYAFPIREFAQDPQAVFSVMESNFAFDTEQSAALRPALERAQEETPQNAAEALGLSEENYVRLIQCVFFALDSKAKASLHIVCDCRAETIRRILTCIYAALPFEFRKKLSYSTYENPSGTSRTLLFSRHSGSALCMNPQTGENNVLSDALQRRWEEYVFMQYVPRNPSTDTEGYWRSLEDKLALFGSAQTVELDFYKIAYDLTMENNDDALSPGVLGKRLNEFLSIPVTHPFIDEQIETILQQICLNEIILNDILSEKLCRRLERSSNAKLIETGNYYNSAKISRMGTEAGAQYLFEAYADRNSESFRKIRDLLQWQAGGKEILDHLYAELIVQALPNERDAIIAYYEETKPLRDRSKIEDKLYGLCLRYLRTGLDGKTDAALLMDTADALLGAALQERRDLAVAVKRELIASYWNAFTYEAFQIDRPELYRALPVQGNSKAEAVHALLETYRAFVERDFDAFWRQTHKLFSVKSDCFTEPERALLVKKLTNACLRARSLYDDLELDVWLVLAHLQRSMNVVQFLIEKRIAGLWYFEKAYPLSTVLGNPKTLATFAARLEAYVQDRAEEYKVAAEALRVIREEEKQARQREKRQPKQVEREGDRRLTDSVWGAFRRPSKGEGPWQDGGGDR